MLDGEGDSVNFFRSGAVAGMTDSIHPFHRMHFLIVDDSHCMRRIIARTLKKMGCATVFEAYSVKTAWEHLRNERIDFIISDWNMPGKKGIDLLHEVRNSEIYKDVPFLMVSAEATAECILEAIKTGVNNYLPKPFAPDILQKKIEVILDAKEGLC